MGVYTTKFYQEKGGYISAVAFGDGHIQMLMNRKSGTV